MEVFTPPLIMQCFFLQLPVNSFIFLYKFEISDSKQ